MRKLLAALAVATACLCFASSAHAAGEARIIYIRAGGGVSYAKLLNDLPAFQEAVNRFSPIWYQDAYWRMPTVLRVQRTHYHPKDAWAVIRLTEVPNCWGCYGFHDFVKGPPRQPYAEVGTYGAWTVTLTHELFEMMVDPFIKNFVQAEDRRYLIEAADPVEDDSFAWALPAADGRTVLISDFPTPAWYQPDAPGPYDYGGFVTAPFQLLCGGYVSWKDANGRWQQDFAPDCI